MKKNKETESSQREFTPLAIILGCIIAIIFGAANAYLGLRVGLTISASIPAAVISMGIVRIVLKRDSILENNMVQTIGSAGEALAAGAIFTIPAAFLRQQEWGDASYISYTNIFLLTLVGGILGVVFMVPLRRALIVKEDATLPYPEGRACAEVLKSGETKGSSSATIFKGLGFSAVYKFLSNGLKVFPESIKYAINGKNFGGTVFGFDALPSLMGVGYIVGPKISAIMLSGGLLARFVFMPLLHAYGGPEIASLAAGDLWSSYIRYIGAGAVATGGIISLIKSLPTIVTSFKDSMNDLKNKDRSKGKDRTDQDLSAKVLLSLLVICLVLIFLTPAIPFNFIAGILIVILGFFFATVSSRMVGIIGSSNNPVSGMSIASVLITSLILKKTGLVGHDGMIAAISIGTIICVIAAVAADCSQDLKTGYIVGASPKYQQVGEMLGVFAASLAIGGVLWLLNESIGFGTDELPAPQATLMKVIIEGVMDGNLPWNLIFVGVFIAILIEMLGISVLPFAIGFYLPFNTSMGIMIGAIVRILVDKLKASDEVKEDAQTAGTLYSAGLIAGEGLMGIILAAFAIIGSGDSTLAQRIDLSSSFQLPQEFSILLFVILGFIIFSKAKKVVNNSKTK